MIGQLHLLENIKSSLGNFPRFSIVVGDRGSGKHLVVDYICRSLGLQKISFGISIDDVRKIIELSYSQDKPICYVCYNADKMSIGAKNSLLKITEEPPQNAYFVLTLQSLCNTLETIQSRATIFQLDPYTEDDLISYRKFKRYGDFFDNVIKDVCSSTGEVDTLFKNDVPSFYSFAENVAFKIQEPTTGNIFKIPKYLKTKEDGEGFDPILLFRAVRNLYIKRAIKEKSSKYLWAAEITSECLRELNLQSVNKVGTVDKWIMDVRTVLR